MNFFKQILFSAFLLISLVQPANALGASFYLSPSQGGYGLGDTFSLKIMIDTNGVRANAAQAFLYFPPDKLTVASVSKNSSVFTLWVKEPSYSNSQGKIDFGGGLPSPGFTGKGEILQVVFRANSPGQAKVYFGNEAILADDGRGTNIFSSSAQGVYDISSQPLPAKPIGWPKLISAPQVSSPTHPQSDKWYKNNNPQFQWELPSGVIGVSAALNKEFIFDPGSVSEGVFESKSYQDVEDGVWYFHIKLKDKNGWGEMAHTKAQIDTNPPDGFEITVDNEGDTANPQPFLYFQAEDNVSGINHYEIKIGEGDVFTLVEVQTNPYKTPRQSPGVHPLEIKAVDYAGNNIVAFSEIKVESIGVPEITVCPSTFISGEEIFIIEGTALPNHTVLVFFEKDNKVVKEWEVFSGENGNWLVSEEGLFRSGEYIVSARAKNSKGAISDSSEKKNVKVILSGIAIGSLLISYSSLSSALFILLVFALIFLAYIFSKIARTRKEIDKETKDLKKKFYKEYYELREDTESQIKILKRKKELSKKEQELEKSLLKNLDDIERVIKKELKDIEDIK